MRIFEFGSLILVFTGFLLVAPAVAQKRLAQSARILSAKTVYFANQTGPDAVGKNALAQLKKWGKFQLVSDRKQADLILLLSADPHKGANIIFASGQTGTTENGRVSEDPVPTTTSNLLRDTPT